MGKALVHMDDDTTREEIDSKREQIRGLTQRRRVLEERLAQLGPYPPPEKLRRTPLS